MVVCLTGHRPNKLYGYDLLDERWQKLKNELKSILIKTNATKAISGMALGCDTIFALAVLELKNEGYDIELSLAIPFKGQENVWQQADKDLYNKICEAADEVVILSDGPYKSYLLQKRNEYMVDNSDLIIAVWNGEKSGTKNCIDYAKKHNKQIEYIEIYK